MKLIKKLGTRRNKSGNSSQSWAKFFCTFCNQFVERELGAGKIAKSCGCVHDELVSKSLKGKTAWNKGKKGYYTCSEETIQKMSMAGKNRVHGDFCECISCKNIKKEKHNYSCNCMACKMKKGMTKGKLNPMYGKVTYGTGRCKWYDYTSSIAGNVRLQGTYELRFAKILDKLGWEWENTKEFFPYCEDHSYVPDFKVLLNNKIIYFDTKGWFSKQDQEKIKQVREVCNIDLIIVTKPILETYERMI